MFRIAASPARSHDTWFLAATTTLRSEIVGLIFIFQSLWNPEADRKREFARRTAFESPNQATRPGGRRRPMPRIVMPPACNGNRIRRLASGTDGWALFHNVRKDITAVGE